MLTLAHVLIVRVASGVIVGRNTSEIFVRFIINVTMRQSPVTDTGDVLIT